MDEKIKELKRRIFILERDNFVHEEFLKDFHYELFTILNWLVTTYIIYQIINYFWGK